jgi:hypothetical protein
MHCVHVKDNEFPMDPCFIYCQKCEVRIHPESPKWRELDPDATFDINRFNHYFQTCAAPAGAGIVEYGIWQIPNFEKPRHD